MSAGVDVVEGCAGGIVWRKSIFGVEDVLLALATSMGGLGALGLVVGWEFGIGGYGAMLGIACVGWAAFMTASLVIRRRIVPVLQRESKVLPSEAAVSAGAYREPERVEPSDGAAISQRGRLYRLRPYKVKLHQRSALGELSRHTGAVAGVVYQRKWICGGELSVWVGESVLVGDDGNAVVLTSPSSRPDDVRLQQFIPLVGDSGRRFRPFWVGNRSLAAAVRGFVARNRSQVIAEGELVLLEAMPESGGGAHGVTRRDVEARVGAIRSLTWVNLERSEPLRLIPLGNGGDSRC